MRDTEARNAEGVENAGLDEWDFSKPGFFTSAFRLDSSLLRRQAPPINIPPTIAHIDRQGLLTRFEVDAIGNRGPVLPAASVGHGVHHQVRRIAAQYNLAGTVG